MVHTPFSDKCQNNDTHSHWKLPFSSCLPNGYQCSYIVLVNIKKMLNNIGQDPGIITCDEGIYSLSKEAQWQVVPQLDSLILRLREFHRAKNFVGSYRKTNG